MFHLKSLEESKVKEENKDIVSFELAKKLAEKGFPQFNSYISYYVGDGNPPFYSAGTVIYKQKSSWDTHLVAAPFIDQVLKWLRLEWEIFIHIDIRVNLEWYYEVWSVKDKLSVLGNVPFNKNNSYEQAVIEGIEYVIESLI